MLPAQCFLGGLFWSQGFRQALGSLPHSIRQKGHLLRLKPLRRPSFRACNTRGTLMGTHLSSTGAELGSNADTFEFFWDASFLGFFLTKIELR